MHHYGTYIRFLCGILSLVCVANARAQLAPNDELKSLKPAEGFDISLFASEPMITNPSAIDIDTHGRVWVTEIQWYRSAAKAPPADKIKVLEDTDGDGRADRMTVFADGLLGPMSICVAGDKVYVATSPDLWVYEDKDGDLKADGPPKKLLTGFKGRNHDHGAHSLVLGPDHKWWMSHGDAGFDVTGTDDSKIEYRWGAVLRGELDGSQLEMVAVNFRNPYEVCVNSFGEAFLSDNDNDGNFSVRICWILEGGNYGWFGKPPAKAPKGTPYGEHWHFRGHLPGFVPGTLVTGFGSPCGICFYEGDAFGPHFRNVPVHADAGPREVRVYPHEIDGYGMKATSEVIVSSKDKYFRPDDVCTAPDGSLFVSDWYDGGVGGHAYNNPNQGRIFRLSPPDKKLSRIGTPGPFTTVATAIDALKNPNLATQYLARERLLAGGNESIEPLTSLLSADDPNYGARALWVLDRIGGAARQKVVEQLKSSSNSTRALAVRILRRHGEAMADQLLPLADDPAPEVRREVLLALRTLKGDKIDAALMNYALAYDGNDRYLLEAIHAAAGERSKQLVAALVKNDKVSFENMDLIQALDPDAAAKFVTAALKADNVSDKNRERLLTRLSTMRSRAAGETVLQIALDRKSSMPAREKALDLVAHGLQDEWKDLADSPQLTAGLPELLAVPELRPTTITMISKQDLRQAAPLLLPIALSSDVPKSERAKALQGAAKFGVEGTTAACESLLADSDKELRTAAMRALVDTQSWALVKKFLLAANVSKSLKQVAAESSLENVAGAALMLQLLDGTELSDDMRKFILRSATKHADASIRALFDRYVPEDERPKRLGTAVSLDEILALTGDERRGSRVFFKSNAARCKACHQVNGFGATIGPDLSQIGKKYEPRALLETILDPSKAIAPEYVMYLVQTADDEVHAGFLIEQNDDEIVLKNVKGETIRIPAAGAVIAPQKQSMMPDLVLQDITAQDAADLLAFLVSLTNQPVDPVVD